MLRSAGRIARSLPPELDKMGFNIEEYNLEETDGGLADFAERDFVL